MKLCKLIFINLFIIISCNKEEPTDNIYLGDRTKVEGRVLEYGSNKPIPNAMIILREGKYVGIWPLNGSYESLDTVYSDQAGKYSIEFIHKAAERPGKADGITYLYEMDCNQDKYFGARGVPVGAGYWYKNKDIILDPYAWIKVHIKNVNPYDENDLCSVRTGGGGVDMIGVSVDTIQIRIAIGNKLNYIVTHVRKNNIFSRKDDSIYVKAFDTAFYQVLY